MEESKILANLHINDAQSVTSILQFCAGEWTQKIKELLANGVPMILYNIQRHDRGKFFGAN